MRIIGIAFCILSSLLCSCRTSQPYDSNTMDLSAADEARLQNFFARMNDPLALIPGRYDEYMSLSEAMLSMPEAERKQIAQGLITSLGIALDAEQQQMLAYGAKEPKALSYIMTYHSDSTLAIGFTLANQAFQGQKLQAEAWTLPNPINLDTFDLGTIEVPKSEPRQLGSNLWQWSPRSDLSDEQVRKNLLFAEVLNRLTDNLTKQGFPSSKVPDTALFKVTYDGKSYDHIKDFIDALKSTGHTVHADVRVRAANFLELYSKRADGKMRSVPVVTHHVPDVPINMSHWSATLPEAHGEFVFSIVPNNAQNTAGRHWNATVAFFQGIGGGARFEQHGFLMNQPWVGSRIVYKLDDSKAVDALRAASMVRHLLRTTAFEENLRDYGYGYLGICSDAVTLVERGLDLPASLMPQLFTEERVKTAGWRFNASTQASTEDRALFTQLWANRPYGNLMSGARRERWKKTFIWKKGTEPYLIAEYARTALECDDASTDDHPCQ